VQPDLLIRSFDCVLPANCNLGCDCISSKLWLNCMSLHVLYGFRNAFSTGYSVSRPLQVRGILGDRFGIICTSVATIAGGLGVAFYFCWSVALVVIGCFPIVAIGGALQFKVGGQCKRRVGGKIFVSGGC